MLMVFLNETNCMGYYIYYFRGIFLDIFSIVFGVVGAFSGYSSFGELPILWQILIILPGLFMLFSLPVSIISEIVQFFKRRRSKIKIE